MDQRLDWRKTTMYSSHADIPSALFSDSTSPACPSLSVPLLRLCCSVLYCFVCVM